ncbi:hypothetical protein ABPG74_012992 [Tetrahymena malaccensis]
MKGFIFLTVLFCLALAQKVEDCPPYGTELNCSGEYSPVCGVKGFAYNKQIRETYYNQCIACKIGHVEYTVEGKCEDYPEDGHFCSPTESKQEICRYLDSPRCGYFNKNVNCTSPPCVQDGKNVCMTCSIKDMLYTTKGKCKK